MPEENTSPSISELVDKLMSSSVEDMIPGSGTYGDIPSFMPNSDYVVPSSIAADDESEEEGSSDTEQGVSLSDITEEISNKSASEHPVPDDEVTTLRMFALNTIALHYYFASNKNWLDAYTTALDELAAVCLVAEGSPIEYNDAASADIAAIELGYPDYESLAQDVSIKSKHCNVLSKFAKDTVKFAKDFWFHDRDFSQVPPAEYARAVTNEIRSNWPAAKMAAGSILKLLVNDEDGSIVDSDGQESRFIGVNETDEYWSPESMAIMPAELWAQACEEDESTLPTDDTTTVDEDLLSLVFLQAYQWENRSWNKAIENAKSFCDTVCTFCWSSIADEFVAEGEGEREARMNRLSELAEELIDDEGNVALMQIQDQFGRVDFEPKSKEFVELFNKQQRAQSFDRIRQADMTLLPLMSKLEGSVAQMLVDDVLASVYERAGGRNEKAQREALDAIHDDILERIDANNKQYKSKWKKYLNSNKEASEAIKRMLIISDIDNDGNPVFDVRGIEQMNKMVQEEKEQQESAEAQKSTKKKRR